MTVRTRPRAVIRAGLQLAATLLLPAWSLAADEVGVASPELSLAANETARIGGFSLLRPRVPVDQIIAGGPERDAIRSVDEPEFVKPAAATWVRGETPVIGVSVGDDARCYPVHVMEYHQVVNDVIGGLAVVVTYDPLTDAAIAYRANPGDGDLHFGVSGLIYSSGFLLFDRQPDLEHESLWSQFLGEALAGPRSGQRLRQIPTRVEPMAQWYARHPDTGVLTRPERYKIDYRQSRYSAYWISEKVPFPVSAKDDRFHPKELVLGVRASGRTRAYVGSIVAGAGARIVDDFVGHRIRVAYDGATGSFLYEAPEEVEVKSAYWFAWKAFYPDTEIWQGDQVAPGAQPGQGAR